VRRVPLSYSLRNLAARRLTTLLTAGGMALVVFVFATVLMLEQGLRQTLVATGSADNVVLIRRGAGGEVQSAIDRAQAGVLETAPEVALGPGGLPLASREVVVLISLAKAGTGRPSNVTVRGVGERGIELRPQVRLVSGRWFRPGSSEVVVGRSVTERFRGVAEGERLRFGQRDWTVVGTFDAEGSAFDSEIWGDADQFMQAFRRVNYVSMLMRLEGSDAVDRLRARLEEDPRITVEAKRENVFYAEQSEGLARFIRYLGLTLSVVFSIGAVIGAMITMYASVANRTAEIGTLRALGFRSRAILVAFLAEALLLGLTGGAIGIAAASLMQSVKVSTTNFQTFAELAFRFELTPAIAGWSLVFAAGMGLVGGVLPAARAARLGIVEALRAA
jgi:ABC-type lipoprotein release transport system permease subunit